MKQVVGNVFIYISRCAFHIQALNAPHDVHCGASVVRSETIFSSIAWEKFARVERMCRAD